MVRVGAMMQKKMISSLFLHQHMKQIFGRTHFLSLRLSRGYNFVGISYPMKCFYCLLFGGAITNKLFYKGKSGDGLKGPHLSDA